jgi:glucose-1-phosphate cytidylyltransferase
MKVVLFCGGMGTRLREHSETIPKPLVNIGYRPIVWHLMRYYAHYGHKDFILCLGYRGDLIKQFFLGYDECASNDFVLSDGGRRIEPLQRDIEDWRITFVETGLHANLGERLLAVRRHVADEEMFLANYADGLSSAPLDRYIDAVKGLDVDAGVLAVRSPQSFHVLQSGGDGLVHAFEPMGKFDLWINAGFFVFRQAIFDWIRPGDELVDAPFQRLIQARRLYSFRYDGFWAAMDTLKDKISFDRRYARGDAPWEVWRGSNASARAS